MAKPETQVNPLSPVMRSSLERQSLSHPVWKSKVVGEALAQRNSFEEGDNPVQNPGSLLLISLNNEYFAIKSQFSKIPIRFSSLGPDRIFIIGFLHSSRDMSLICFLSFRYQNRLSDWNSEYVSQRFDLLTWKRNTLFNSM